MHRSDEGRGGGAKVRGKESDGAVGIDGCNALPPLYGETENYEGAAEEEKRSLAKRRSSKKFKKPLRVDGDAG